MSLQKRFLACLLLFSLPFTFALVWCLCGAVLGEDQNTPSEMQRPEAVLQMGHRRAVQVVVFSPDDRWLASGAKDNTIKIWEVATGRLLRTLYGHGNAVNALAVSPDGKLLASGSGDTYDVRYEKLFFAGGQVGGHSEDTSVRLWDVTTGRPLQVMNGHLLAVRALAFSPDGHSLISASSDVIQVWNISTGKPIRTVKAIDIQVFKDSLRHTMFGGEAKAIKKERTQRFEDQASRIIISSGGESAAVGYREKKFRLFDIAHGREIRDLNASAGPEANGSVSLSGDGQLIAYVRDGTKLVVEKTQSGQVLWESPLAKHDHGVVVQFTRNANAIACEIVNGAERILDVWSISSGKLTSAHIIKEQGESRLLMFSSDAHLFAVVSRGSSSIELRELATGHLLHTYGTSQASTVDDPDLRKRLETLGFTGEGELKEAQDEVGDFSAAYQADDAITFTLDNHWLLIKHGRPGKIAEVDWDTAAGTSAEAVSAGELEHLGNPGFSPDGRFHVAPHFMGEDKRRAPNLDVDSWQALRITDTQHAGKPQYLDLGALWETGVIPAFGFSPDGLLIAATGYLGKVGRRKAYPAILLYKMETRKKISKFETPFDDRHGPIETLAVSEDGTKLALAYRNELITVVDSKSGKELLNIKHSGGVSALSFRQDGRLIAALGKDRDAYLFDARTGDLLATLITTRNVDGAGNSWLVVAPDGKFDGSPAGWNQLLWRFGGNTFDVAAVETFFNEYYYPGLLADILAGKKLRETRDFARLDRRQPSLQIKAVGSSGAQVDTRTVQVQVRVAEAPSDKDHTAGSRVRDVRLFRNGSLVKAWRGDLALGASGQALLETTIPIVAGPNRLTAYAFNRDNIKSADASLVVTGNATLKRTGVAYVLSIGIDHYTNPTYNLKFAVADAQDLSETLRVQQRKVGSVGTVEVILLLNSEATKENILLALKRLAGSVTGDSAGAPEVLNKLQAAQPEDEVFLYFAGHGAANGQRFFLIPHDIGYTGRRTELNQAGLDTIMAHSISDEELEAALEKVDARDVLLVIDACNSGQALEAEERRRGPMNSKGLAQLAYEKGMYVLTAAQGFQAAIEVKELGHGLLTYALVEEGLKTSAADLAPKDGKVVAREWMDYATRRVPELQKAQIEAAQKQGRGLTFAAAEEEDLRGGMKIPGLQRPRVFYRRGGDLDPLIVAIP